MHEAGDIEARVNKNLRMFDFDGKFADMAGVPNRYREGGFEAFLGRKVSGHFLDLLKGVFRLDPEERLSAKDIVEHPFFRSVRRSRKSADLSKVGVGFRQL